MIISVIFPAYNEEGNLPVLFKRLVAVAEQVEQCSFEFIFVDDYSTDRTPAILTQLRAQDPRVQIIRLARNCGSHAAIDAGLKFCNGDAAIVLAADLQDPPEIIPCLLEQWQKGFKTVWAVREKRGGEEFVARTCSKVFQFLMNILTDVHLPAEADAFLTDRVVIKALEVTPEKNSEICMLIAWLGFSQTNITYIQEPRYSGVSKWTLSKRLKLFYDSLISFSYTPLRLMSTMGAILATIGLIYGVDILIAYLMGNSAIAGWASLMIVVLIIGGFQMCMMGILGEYLWRTYDETRGRPKYVIEKNTLLESEQVKGSEKISAR